MNSHTYLLDVPFPKIGYFIRLSKIACYFYIQYFLGWFTRPDIAIGNQ